MNKREVLKRILAGDVTTVKKYRKEKELDLLGISAVLVCVDDDDVERMPDKFSIQTGDTNGHCQSHLDCTMDDWDNFVARVDTSHPKHRIFMLRVVKCYKDDDDVDVDAEVVNISKDDFTDMAYK